MALRRIRGRREAGRWLDLLPLFSPCRAPPDSAALYPGYSLCYIMGMDSTPLMTDYFRRDVLEKRPYIRLEWCLAAVANPVRREVQPDGRVRHWWFVPELDKYLRVVTLEDGATLHNAFPDRRFKP